MSNSLANLVGILYLAEDDDVLMKKLMDIGVDVFGNADTFEVALAVSYIDLDKMREDDFHTLLSAVFRDNLLVYKAEQEAKGNEA